MIYRNIFLSSFLVLLLMSCANDQTQTADEPVVQDQTTEEQATQDQDNAATVSGRVVDTSTDEMLSNIEVILRSGDETEVEQAFDSEEHRAITDDSGEFSIEGVEPGTYTIQVEEEGYEGTEQTINVSGDEEEEIEIPLLPSRF